MTKSTLHLQDESLIPIPSLSQVCHYSRHTFFKFDQSKGQIRDRNQHQYVLASDDFIVSLLKGLEHEVGELKMLRTLKFGLNGSISSVSVNRI